MKIPTEIEYALLALMHLSRQWEKGWGKENWTPKPISVTRIARDNKLSRDFVEQLLLRLRRAGLVTSVRGVQGGYRMAMDPHLVTLSTVFRAIRTPDDSTIIRLPCATTGCAHRTRRMDTCRLNKMWADVSTALELKMEDHTIGDLIDG